MDARSIIVILSIILLNNFLQSDFMLDIVNRNVGVPMGMDSDLGLPTDKQMEAKVSMSMLHTAVLIVLVTMGVATQLDFVTKAISNATKKTGVRV